jgi:hypothetical protein
MALTMTRTRTQTTLNKLAEMLANVNGEQAFVEGLLMRTEGAAAEPEARMRLEARRQKLTADRAALCATIRQFDAELDPERVGTLEGWRLKFGNRRLSARGLEARYLE